MSRYSVRVLGKGVVAISWVLAFTLTSAISLEFLLRLRASSRELTRYQKLKLAYGPFGVQHLHPQFLFFFPLTQSDRVSLSNEICSLDQRGFRGPGPEFAGKRKLAFLLGGSAAFGWDASSNMTTITGYLNRLQDDYFFVNAGVPSWNSTQEMIRVAFQVLDYRPALIVAYNGANDAGLMDEYKAGIYPPGTPESFDKLAAVIDDIRANVWSLPRFELDSFFPELVLRIRVRLLRAEKEPEFISDDTVRKAAIRYLSNLIRMRDMSIMTGARFVAVFQPIASLHAHVDPDFGNDAAGTFNRFHRAVVGNRPHDLEFHDFSNLFDAFYQDVPVMKSDVTDDTIFTDEVHLYDPGNSIVAGRLLEVIKTSRVERSSVTRTVRPQIQWRHDSEHRR